MFKIGPWSKWMGKDDDFISGKGMLASILGLFRCGEDDAPPTIRKRISTRRRNQRVLPYLSCQAVALLVSMPNLILGRLCHREMVAWG